MRREDAVEIALCIKRMIIAWSRDDCDAWRDLEDATAELASRLERVVTADYGTPIKGAEQVLPHP